MDDKAEVHHSIVEQPTALEGYSELAAQIAEGFAQAERGELFNASEAKGILRERRAKRQYNGT